MIDVTRDNPSFQGAHPLAPTWKRLDALHDLEENWNGYEVAAPDPDAIEQAKQWLQTMYHDLKNKNYRWLSPHVTANEEGIVVFEWVQGRKRLSVFILQSEAWHIKAWGPDILEEMTDGPIITTEDRLTIWTWLLE